MPADQLTLTLHMQPPDEEQVRRVSALLASLPEGVRDGLLGRLGDFVRLRYLHDGPAPSALDAPTGLGRLAWRVDILEQELIAAARAACRESSDRVHGGPPDAN